MTARDRSEHTPPPAPEPNRWPALSPEDAAHVAELVRRGVLTVGPEFGQPFDEDDELNKPGPSCPGMLERFLQDRRSGW